MIINSSRLATAIFLMLCFFISLTTPANAQLPVITAQFANPEYDCNSNQYCLDVEFMSNMPNKRIFGMNVRMFYDDAILELIGFSSFSTGYGAVVPNPPLISTSIPAGPALFNFAGPAEFINGAIQLVNANATPIYLDTDDFTKLFEICFIVNGDPDDENFCAPVVWDLEQNPANGGFLAGDDGVVITLVDPDPNIDSSPTTENVSQYNWQYTGNGPAPFGEPVEDICISIDCSLPVRLLSFTGFATELGNHLEWKTIFETNNAGFDVERSADGYNWETLGFVEGFGTVQQKEEYSYMDNRPLKGMNMYRLKQLDIDGRYSYSSIVIVEGDKLQHASDIYVYPNPVTSGALNVALDEQSETATTVRLFNAAGYLVREAQMDNILIEMDVHDLPAGLYLVQVNTGSNKLYRKVVIENSK